MVGLPKYRKLLGRACKVPSHVHQVHASMIKTGADTQSFPLSKLLSAAVPLDFAHALSLFSTIPRPNLFMFNSILRGHSDPHLAVSLFNTLRALPLPLDPFSLIATLSSCCCGRAIHALALSSGLLSFLNLRNALLSSYSRSGLVGDARKLFDEMPGVRDEVSWSALMTGYSRVRFYDAILALFRQMRYAGFRIIPAVAVITLSAAVRNGMDRDKCESVHCYFFKAGLHSNTKLASSMITAYSRCDLVESAQRIFDMVPEKDLVVWNCMVDGYARTGCYEEAFRLLERMTYEGFQPNESTVSALLSACASSGNLLVGQQIHEYVEAEKMGDVVVTALVDMYSSCGWVDKAAEIFEQAQSRDVQLWTAMISAFGAHGQPKAALELFRRMLGEGLSPNEVTFLAVLSACNHGGLVASGQQWFKRMVLEFHCTPNAHHYGCTIDLLARAGMLDEAHELIQNLHISEDPVAWRGLLSACRVHGNAELGVLARQRLMELGDEHPTDSILISRTCAFAGQSESFISMGSETKKEAGWSAIEITD